MPINVIMLAELVERGLQFGARRLRLESRKLVGGDRPRAREERCLKQLR
jgi:hypothetical protein